MKILIIRNYPSYMDVVNNTYNIQEVGLAKALVRKGHICDIIFWTGKEEKVVEIPVNESGSIKIYYKKGITALKNTIFLGCGKLYESYDILQPCEYNQAQAWILSKRYPHKTCIYHGPYFSAFNKRYNLMCKFFDMFFLKTYIKQKTAFLVKSTLAKEFLVSKGIAAKDVSVTGVGIDTQMLSSTESMDFSYIANDMKEHTGYTKFLYIGQFEERRNIFFILDVFGNIKKHKKDVRLYLIGKGKDDYVNSVLEYAQKLNLMEYIVWEKKVEQKKLSTIYSQADIFLLPTQYEIFGMVLLEAMYYENIVITTKNGGSSTLFNNENGIIMNEFNVNSWTSCILELISNNEKMNKIKKQASKTISGQYTWDTLASKFENQYLEKIMRLREFDKC